MSSRRLLPCTEAIAAEADHWHRVVAAFKNHVFCSDGGYRPHVGPKRDSLAVPKADAVYVRIEGKYRILLKEFF